MSRTRSFAAAAAVASFLVSQVALAQDSVSPVRTREWRRVCPGVTAQTWYFADSASQSAGTWKGETPFLLDDVQGDWALGTRACDGKKAWIRSRDVCDLDNQRRVCGAPQTDLFWADSPAQRSGRLISEGSKVSLLELSPVGMVKIEFRGERFWMWDAYVCPIDPNVGSSSDGFDVRVQGGSTCGNPRGAFLSTIGFAEGTGDRYNIIFGFGTFNSFAGHPRRRFCSNGLCSDAAGRYQILSKTWDTVIQPSLRLPDFTPARQDTAAVFLMRNRGVRSVDGEFDFNAFSRAIYKLNLEWASLPGSPYGQPTRSMNQLWSKYRDRLGCGA